MIKAASGQLVYDVFKGRIPYFECREVDSYTGEVTLFDSVEYDHEITTTLWINGYGDYCVSIDKLGEILTEEQYSDISDAWKAYERQSGEPVEEHDELETTDETETTDELLGKCVEIVARKYDFYLTFCKTGHVKMAGTYLDAYEHCLMMAEEITGIPCEEIESLVKKELEKCSRTPF